MRVHPVTPKLSEERQAKLETAYHAGNIASLAWYTMAMLKVKACAELLNITHERFAHIVAALSPSCPWVTNLAQACEFVQSGGTSTVTTYGAQRAKAYALLTGAPLASIYRDYTNNPKTWCFAQCLRYGDNDIYTVVDRRIGAIVGEDIRPGNYWHVSGDIAAVAQRLNVQRTRVQARAWDGATALGIVRPDHPMNDAYVERWKERIGDELTTIITT